MSLLVFELDAAPGMADALCRHLGVRRGTIERRQFPDNESYVRLNTDVTQQDVILLCTLDRPDSKTLPLLFTAAAARAQGARSVGLVAPYLAYLRQDRAFKKGEAITSVTFADVLSSHISWLVTMDPHLHRYASLSDVYSVPSTAASASDAIGDWINQNVERPVLIGPDEESSQWVERIAGMASAEAVVLRKTRTGDHSVSIDNSVLRHLPQGTPVIVDDIASSARTMIETVKLLKTFSGFAPVCVIIHPIFAGDAYGQLLRAGPAHIVSTNSIQHVSNAIDISAPLAEAVRMTLQSDRLGWPQRSD